MAKFLLPAQRAHCDQIVFALRSCLHRKGNCPSNDCPSCPCGTSTSMQSISEWCGKFSGWDQGCCQCIMSHESSGNANAANYNTNGSFDVGLWQVNSVNWSSW